MGPPELNQGRCDVSVIMPTFRRPEYLTEALRNLLEVSSLSIEIMVIDDSADAEGAAVVAAFGDGRIQYYRRAVPSGGRPAILRNDAARKAAGDVFYFLDDDDLVISEALPAAYTLLHQAPQGTLLTLPRPFGPNAEKVEREIAYYEKARKILERRPSAYEVDARLTFTASFVVPSACLIKRSAYARVGGFDEDFPLCEDVDFFAKAIASDGYVLGDMAIVRRRVGHSSLISDARAEALHRSYIQLHRGFKARRGAMAYWTNRIKYKLREVAS
jgi:glycosyltransferase involved in cell wall biosynthesis